MPQNRLSKLIKNTICPPRDPKTNRFHGKTIVITDGTSEIGIQTAIKFARLRASRIIIGAYDRYEGVEACQRIVQEANCGNVVVQCEVLDMSSFSSVENFVNIVRISTSMGFGKVHAVIINSSFAYRAEDINPVIGPHGADLCLQVNVLSKAYLAILFLPLLFEASLTQSRDDDAPTHLEFVCGVGEYGSKYATIDDRTYATYARTCGSIVRHLKFFPDLAYQFEASKFLEMVIAMELAKCTDQSGVIVTVACPGGPLETPHWREPDSQLSISSSQKLSKQLFARTYEQGSRTLVSGVLQGRNAHGMILKDDHCHRPNGWDLSPQDAGHVLGPNVWREVLEGFRRMGNRKTIEAIMYNGLLAENTETLQLLHPTGYKLALGSQNDQSFWGTGRPSEGPTPAQVSTTEEAKSAEKRAEERTAEEQTTSVIELAAEGPTTQETRRANEPAVEEPTTRRTEQAVQPAVDEPTTKVTRRPGGPTTAGPTTEATRPAEEPPTVGLTTEATERAEEPIPEGSAIEQTKHVKGPAPEEPPVHVSYDTSRPKRNNVIQNFKNLWRKRSAEKEHASQSKMALVNRWLESLEKIRSWS